MPPLGGASGRVARLIKGGLPDPLAMPSGGRDPGCGTSWNLRHRKQNTSDIL
jgi:hypothetical protein